MRSNKIQAPPNRQNRALDLAREKGAWQGYNNPDIIPITPPTW
jgi:hypothetical protein